MPVRVNANGPSSLSAAQPASASARIPTGTALDSQTIESSSSVRVTHVNPTDGSHDGNAASGASRSTVSCTPRTVSVS